MPGRDNMQGDTPGGEKSAARRINIDEIRINSTRTGELGGDRLLELLRRLSDRWVQRRRHANVARLAKLGARHGPHEHSLQ